MTDYKDDLEFQGLSPEEKAQYLEAVDEDYAQLNADEKKQYLSAISQQSEQLPAPPAPLEENTVVNTKNTNPADYIGTENDPFLKANKVPLQGGVSFDAGRFLGNTGKALIDTLMLPVTAANENMKNYGGFDLLKMQPYTDPLKKRPNETFEQHKARYMQHSGQQREALVKALMGIKENPGEFVTYDLIPNLLGGGGAVFAPKLLAGTARGIGKGVVSNISEPLAGIPKDLTLHALEKELAGNSLFKGKFNEATAYNPVSQKMNAAYRDLFTPEQTFIDKLKAIPENLSIQAKKLGQKAKTIANKNLVGESNFNIMFKGLSDRLNKGIDFIEREAGEAVKKEADALGKSKIDPIDPQELNQIINSVKKEFSAYGSELNTAEEAANISKIQNWIKKAAGEKQQNLILDANGKPYKTQSAKVSAGSVHNLKQLIQGMANYTAENSTIANRFYKELADKYNNLLRAKSSEYAKVNDAFKEIQELKSSLPSKAQLPEKMANFNSARTFLSGNQDILKQADKILPNDYKFADDLQKALSLQEKENLFIGNLKESVFNDISKYKNAPLDVQNAFEQLNKMSPDDMLGQFSRAEKEKLFKEMLLKGTQENEQALKNSLDNAIFRNPAIIKNPNKGNTIPGKLSPEEAFTLLNETASTENKFMPLLDDIYTRSAFESYMPARGYTTGGGIQGIGNIVRAALLNKTGAGLLPVFSPKLGYKPAIQALGAAGRAEKLLPLNARYGMAGINLTEELLRQPQPQY